LINKNILAGLFVVFINRSIGIKADEMIEKIARKYF